MHPVGGYRPERSDYVAVGHDTAECTALDDHSVRAAARQLKCCLLDIVVADSGPSLMFVEDQGDSLGIYSTEQSIDGAVLRINDDSLGADGPSSLHHSKRQHTLSVDLYRCR